MYTYVSVCLYIYIYIKSIIDKPLDGIKTRRNKAEKRRGIRRNRKKAAMKWSLVKEIEKRGEQSFQSESKESSACEL